MEKKPYTFSNWEHKFIRDMINYLKRNGVLIYDESNRYRGAEAILAEVRAKFENSKIL